MSGRGLFRATLDGMVPVDRQGRELWAQLLRREPRDRPVYMNVRTPRNPEFSALAHLVFTKIAEGLGQPMDAVKMYLKERTGRFDVVQVNGKTMHRYHSVSFASMTEEQFRDFWRDCEPIIVGELLGGLKSRERDEIVAIMNGDDRDYTR